MNIQTTSKSVVLALLACSISAAARGDTPLAVPTFHCIGLYWNTSEGSPDNTCRVRYRPAGSDTWKTALPLWFDSRPPETFNRPYPPDRYKLPPKEAPSLLNHANQYRGSIVNLSPATKYQIELCLEKTGHKAVLTAATWSERFPIAATVPVPDNNAQTLVIDRSGSPEGYVLYKAADASASAIIDVAAACDHCIEVRASYVIIKGLVLKNSRTHAIHMVTGCVYVLRHTKV